MSFYFLTGFFKYFFRVLHEASSSWLKLCWFILGHPVCVKTFIKKTISIILKKKKRMHFDNVNLNIQQFSISLL
jgi:hypothetical protein